VTTRILNRLLPRRRRRWTEPDTLTRLPLPGSAGKERDTFLSPVDPPDKAGDDELAVRAHLFHLLGVGGPR